MVLVHKYMHNKVVVTCVGSWGVRKNWTSMCTTHEMLCDGCRSMHEILCDGCRSCGFLIVLVVVAFIEV